MPDESDKELQLNVDEFSEPNQFPDVLVEVLDTTPFLIGGEDRDTLQLLREGRCVVCRKVLGEDTVIVLSAFGISAMSCSGLCHDDLIRLGHLSEQAQDIIDSIEARRSIHTGGHD